MGEIRPKTNSDGVKVCTRKECPQFLYADRNGGIACKADTFYRRDGLCYPAAVAAVTVQAARSPVQVPRNQSRDPCGERSRP